MSKKRALDSSIRTSQTFAALSYRQRDLWQGLIAIADDQGRLPGTAAYVRSQVWPYDDILLGEVEIDLAHLIDLDMILQYEVNGKTFIQLINWWKYQSPQWAGASDFPSPPGWMDRTRYHGKDHVVLTENWDKPGGFAPVNELPDLSPEKLPELLPEIKEAKQVSKEEKEEEKENEEEKEEEKAMAAGKPPPTPPSLPLSEGQKYFLASFGAVRFKTNIQRRVILELEKQFGTTRLHEATDWAAKRGMSLGDAVQAIESALPKWGSTSHGKNGAGPPKTERKNPFTKYKDKEAENDNA